MYGYLEAERIKYTIRLPANRVLQDRIGYLLKCPVGRPSNEVLRSYASFTYQAGSWLRPCRVNPIFSSLGGFFTTDDNDRHAIVGTTEGKIFEIFFNPRGTSQAYLACFDAIAAADAFFTPDDNSRHVVVATPEGNISEIFFNQTGTFFSTPPLANFSGILAISGFFTSDDGFRHVIVATNDGNLTEVFYSSQSGSHVSQPPLAKFSGILAISGFFTSDDGFRHVIVATADGNITEVFYNSQSGAHVSQPPLANFPGIVDIAAFYTDDDHNRHVIVATNDGKVTEVFYHPSIGVHVSQPALATFNNIVAIAGFYTSDDGFRHVIVATGDGNITEVFYSSQSGSHVSQPPLGVFAISAPALEDISPDVSNLDANASAVLSGNNISTAGRSVSIAGNASALFVFNEKAGIWKNTGGVNWSQLPGSPLSPACQQVNVDAPRLDAVVANPPYVRQEDIPSQSKDAYRKLVKSEVQLNASGRSDLHVYFWGHAVSFMKPGAWLGFLTSSQWLDVEYGFALQHFLLERFKVVAIIESRMEPWFVGARVQTAATIAQLESDSKQRADNLIRFVQVRRPIAEVLASDGTSAGAMAAADEFRDRILSTGVDTTTDAYRIRCVKQSDLIEEGLANGAILKGQRAYAGAKWGIPLRAPDVWEELQLLGGDRWKRRIGASC